MPGRKIFTATILAIAVSVPAIALAGDREMKQEHGMDGKKDRHHKHMMKFMMDQKIIQDDDYLYILRGPELVKVSKKDLSVKEQAYIKPEHPEKDKKKDK